MAAVSETIVREYFELRGFFVRQPRKYITAVRREQDDDIDFLVVNPHPKTREGAMPFILGDGDIPYITRAVVVVKGWHTETFSPAVLANAPEIFRFVEPTVFQQALKAFGGDGNALKVLVVPALPQSEEARQQSIELLRIKGIDAVILFSTLLAGLIERVETNRNYQKSDLLQVLRVLKNYEFLREPQLELFKPSRKRKTKFKHET